MAGRQFEDWDRMVVEIEAILAIKDLLEPWMMEAKGLIIEGENGSVIQFFQQKITGTEMEQPATEKGRYQISTAVPTCYLLCMFLVL